MKPFLRLNVNGMSNWGKFHLFRCMPIMGVFLFCLFPSSSMHAAGKSYQEIYEQVFKTPFVKTIQAYESNLIVNGRFLGKVSLFASATGPIERISVVPFADILRPQLNEQAYLELVAMADSEGFVSEKQLSLAGYTVLLSRSVGYLTITVPRDKRTEFVYMDMKGGAWRPIVQKVSDPKLAGYVNVSGSSAYFDTEKGQSSSPFSLDLESVLTTGEFTLRQVANLQTESPKTYALSEAQVIHDDMSNFTRYMAGNVSFPKRGLQGSPKVFGVGLGRLYYLDRRLIDEYSEKLSVKVPKDGVMTLTLNGTELRRFPVEEGTYIFDNVPVRIGVNRIGISLENTDGTREEREESLVRDVGLIGVNQHEFYYTAGVYADVASRDYVVNSQKPVVSGYHLYRPASFWVQGGYIQLDSTQRLLGSESYFPTDLGVFRVDVAHYYQEAYSDMGGTLEYLSYYDPGGLIGYQKVSFSSFGPFFRRFGEVSNMYISRSLSSDTQLNFNRTSYMGARTFAEEYYSKPGTYYGGELTFAQNWDWLRGSLGVNYRRNTTNVSDYHIFVDVYAKLTPEFESSLQLRWQKPKQIDDVFISYYVTWMPDGGQRGHRLSAGVQGSDQTRRLDYVYNFGDRFYAGAGSVFSSDKLRQTDLSFGERGNYSDLQINSNFSDFDNTYDSQHALRYWNTRGLLDMRFFESKSKYTPNFNRQLAYRFDTAVAFVDGQVAVGRPIRSNFVLIYPEKGLEGRAFTAGSNGLVDMFGPALLTDLAAFSESMVMIGDIPDVPEGYDLGPMRQAVSVGYYGGQSIRVGNGMRVRVFGKAKTAAGPLAYVACEVFRESEPSIVLNRILTGADGGFLIQGIEHGSYGLRFNAFTNDVLYFEIADDDSVRSYDMGDLLLSQKEIAPPQE